ncbi:MAG: hypothetical protein CMA12_04195 [Euryarchaeota archaeon]|nr:hypothetical protein [Euryarchaeota archaeon]OUW22356.1 MAG: hypothetical protein CBD33_02540 [Euryarchaeota archaeon TMED173]|tara:strand:+ start:76 stop:678 length:603 start_codon:yes stop_codon:yes gene_type:complete
MDRAMDFVLSEGCIVYPTSTLPALGCIPTINALDILFKIKGRSRNNPVSLGVSSLNQASEIVEIPEDVRLILKSFPDGSLTIILKSHRKMDARLGGEKVAIRVVTDTKARELIERTGPLTATSANISGEEPLLNCILAANQLSSPELPVLGIEGVCEGGSPSTLIAWHTVCDSPESMRIEVVREGKISSEEVLAWWKKMI